MDQVIQLQCGAIVTPLKRILNPKGDVYHGLKATDDTFFGFGEAYFSTVYPGVTKGWKRHERMTLNLVVPVGEIDFHLRSDGEATTDCIRLGETNYARLTVPPGLWMAFTGVGESLNLLLNVASIEHDPSEAVNVPLESFPLGRG
ncbi:dTDP-4-dehydrorhamnose 3,5-epimerase [Pandoraea pnomenusa]|uniref:dTDP-4-dehydrorhamnose 3,5-epimerase n=1 Tax=Pandoraea pnomenusa TaxID=93220 RepID=UPI003341A78D